MVVSAERRRRKHRSVRELEGVEQFKEGK